MSQQSGIEGYQQAAPAGTPAPPGGPAGRAKTRELRILPEGTPTAGILAGVWILLIVASTIYRGSFLSRETVLSVTFTMAVAGVLTIGQSLVTISGGVLDLSIPTALILPAWIMATLLTRGYSLWLTLLIGLATGTAWGCLNAAIIVFGKIN
ncbi:MAG TPA: hypothetical protein VHZ03_26335, partial [Trebonia sp.]|nr:hypothetical protein [Trebonia sp.]